MTCYLLQTYTLCHPVIAADTGCVDAVLELARSEKPYTEEYKQVNTFIKYELNKTHFFEKMDNDLKDRNTFYTEVGLQIRDGDQLSLGPPQIVSPCTFLRATSHGGGPRTSPMGVPDPQLHR